MAGTAGRSGRRPKPTARKALAGNPGKRALNKDEPVFTPIKGVEPPEWFAEENLPLATIMWQLTTKELCGQGLLCVTAREAISLAAATEEHGARLFSNGAVTSGVLRTEQTLSDQAYERLKKDFEERHTGLGNAHRPMILEMGLDWKSMALNAEDSQFLETRKFQLEEICRLFRVPLHMVQNTDRATFNNIEELGLGFINYSLVPYPLWSRSGDCHPGGDQRGTAGNLPSA